MTKDEEVILAAIGVPLTLILLLIYIIFSDHAKTCLEGCNESRKARLGPWDTCKKRSNQLMKWFCPDAEVDSNPLTDDGDLLEAGTLPNTSNNTHTTAGN